MTRLPRSAWTDTPPAAPARLDPSRVRGLAVHWLGPPAPDAVYAGDREAVARYLRGVRRFHVAGRGWSDIAYQFAVDALGRRWELRGWRLQSAANGDALVNGTHGALLLLLGAGQSPTPAMLAGAREAVVEFRRQYPGAVQIAGHRQVRPDPTDCPGDELMRLIRAGRLDPRRNRPKPRPPIGGDDVSIDELVRALRDDTHPLSRQLRRHVREAVQAELADQAAGRNPRR